MPSVAEGILQVIRPCRESTTGWTPEAARRPGNQISFALNEHGPALKVFWRAALPPLGAEPVPTRLANNGAAGVKERGPGKPGRREPGPGAIPARSFRSEIGVRKHGLDGARTRWVTERIASPGAGSTKPMRNQKERKRRIESGLQMDFAPR